MQFAVIERFRSQQNQARWNEMRYRGASYVSYSRDAPSRYRDMGETGRIAGAHGRIFAPGAPFTQANDRMRARARPFARPTDGMRARRAPFGRASDGSRAPATPFAHPKGATLERVSRSSATRLGTLAPASLFAPPEGGTPPRAALVAHNRIGIGKGYVGIIATQVAIVPT